MVKQFKKDSLGDRMKGYEKVNETILASSKPIILRLDGKAFHTYTKGMNKPFDDTLGYAMKETMKFLCEEIADCRFGYTQSDEITLVLTSDIWEDYSPWFQNKLQKIISTASSICTFKFNSIMYEKTGKVGLFDCRAFSIPDYVEASNCLFWRQLDATRNSVQMLAQAHYRQKELNGLSCDMLKEKLITEKGLNWGDLDSYKKWGAACYKSEGSWIVDKDTIVFKENWEYVYKHIRKPEIK